MKKTLLAFVVAALSANAMAKTDKAELSKELEIMTGILQTSLKQGMGKQSIRYRGIDATYLAGQGVLFELNTTSSGLHFSFHGIGDLVVPVAPVAPIVVAGGDSDWTIDIDEGEWQELAKEAMEEAREAMRDAREKLRDLRGREREYAWEQRELERKVRDLEFEKRSSDQKRKAKLEERSQRLRQEMADLQVKLQEVNNYAKQIEAEQKKQMEERNANKIKEHNRFLANLEANIGDTLCKYGAGLKSLPKGENISFILPQFGAPQESKNKQDKIYVFKHTDVQDCVRDKITSNNLLERADTYLF